MNVRLSKLAIYKLEKLLYHLENKWSAQSKAKFLTTLNKKFETLSNNPKIHPSSSFNKNIRKLVISKQTSAYYLIKDNTIYVITIFDNRQNQKTLLNEIKKHFL